MLGVPVDMWVVFAVTCALTLTVYVRVVRRFQSAAADPSSDAAREADKLWKQMLAGQDFDELNAVLHEAEWDEKSKLRNATEDYLLSVRHAGGIGLTAAKLSGTATGSSWLELVDGKKLKLDGILFGVTGVRQLAMQAVSDEELIELRDISRHANVWQLLLGCGDGHALLVVNDITVIDAGAVER